VKESSKGIITGRRTDQGDLEIGSSDDINEELERVTHVDKRLDRVSGCQEKSAGHTVEAIPAKS
jgi:hypothetical protein